MNKYKTIAFAVAIGTALVDCQTLSADSTGTVVGSAGTESIGVSFPAPVTVPGGYFIQLLAPPPGAAWVQVTAMNNAGQVVGLAWIDDGNPDTSNYRAVVWTNGIPQLLPLLPNSGGHATAYGITKDGSVIGSDTVRLQRTRGTYTSFFPFERSFVWTPEGKTRDLNFGSTTAVENPIDSWVAGVSEDGKIAANFADSLDCAFVGTTSGSPTILANPLAPERSWVSLFGISRSGNAFGRIYPPFAEPLLVLYLNNQPVVLPGGGYSSYVFGANSVGEAVGSGSEGAIFWDSDHARHVLQMPSGITTPGAYSINDSGAIVGSANLNPTTPVAVLWTSFDQPCVDLNTKLTGADSWTLQEGTVINDRGQIAGAGLYNGTYSAFLLTPVSLVVDANRDGTIKLDGSDNIVTEESPYRFWTNDDDDELVDDSKPGLYSELEEDDKDITDPNKEDWRNNVIDVPRDLEDFARIDLYIGGMQDALKTGGLFLGLKWSDTNGTNPAIKLYRSTGSLASPDYLFDAPAANRQSLEAAIIDARYPDYSGEDFQSNHTLIAGSDFFVIPTIQLSALSASNSTVRFIFEGCTIGRGQLKPVILKKDGTTYTEMCEGPSVWMDIQKPNQFVERFSCGEGSGGPVAGSVTMHPGSGPQFATPTKDEERDYVLYVHGYNMALYEKQRWLEAVYKRLYWLGFKGRVGGFSWPCASGLVDQLFYDISEERAWQSGVRLKEHIQSLNARGYRVHAIGHSQGNVVVAEALRLWRSEGNSGPLVRTYIASQAALPAACYNPSVPWMPDHDEDTPDVYSRYWQGGSDSNQLPETWPSTNPSYMSDTFMASAASRWANFYNISDYALTGNTMVGHPGWEIDQRQKPNDHLSPARYSYTSAGGFKKVDSTVHNLLFPNDRYEIFSYGAGAWSLALGTIPTGGVFTNFNNLQTNLGYGSEHIYHSAQFRGPMATRYQYWIGLLDAAVLPHLNP